MKKLICGFLLLTVCVFCFCSCSVLKQVGSQREESQEQAAQEIKLDCYEKTISKDQTFQLEAVASTDETVKWKSSNENVVLVNSQGKVTAVNTGVANVICYFDSGMEAVCTVTVIKSEKEKTSSAQTVLTESTFIFPHSSTAYLTEGEVETKLSAMSGKTLSGEYAQDAINEIYARNGYVFKKPHLNAYYSAQSWYAPDASFSTADFNEYEKKNIALLKTFL